MTKSSLDSGIKNFFNSKAIQLASVRSSIFMLDLNDKNNKLTSNEKIKKYIPIIGESAHELKLKNPEFGTDKFIGFIPHKGKDDIEKTNHFSRYNLTSAFIKFHAEYFLDKLNNEFIKPCLVVPYLMKVKQREELLQAARDAGFKNIDFVTDCDAAFCYYVKNFYFAGKKRETLTIFVDIGAYYFRIFAYLMLDEIKLKNFYNQLIRYELYSNFSGDLITRKFAESIKTNYGLYIPDDMYDQYLDIIEVAKIRLSTKQSVKIDLSKIIDGVYITIDRSEFENVISGIVNSYCDSIKKFLEHYNMGYKIQLYGGTSYIPFVRRKITEMFGNVKFNLRDESIYADGALLLKYFFHLKQLPIDNDIIIRNGVNLNIIPANASGNVQLLYKRITCFDSNFLFESKTENFSVRLLEDERYTGDIMYMHLSLNPLKIDKITNCVYHSCETMKFRYVIDPESSKFAEIIRNNYGKYFRTYNLYYAALRACDDRSVEQNTEMSHICSDLRMLDQSNATKIYDSVDPLLSSLSYHIETKDFKSKKCKEVLFRAKNIINLNIDNDVGNNIKALFKAINSKNIIIDDDIRNNVIKLYNFLTDRCSSQSDDEIDNSLLDTLSFWLDIIQKWNKIEPSTASFTSILIEILIICFIPILLYIFIKLYTG